MHCVIRSFRHRGLKQFFEGTNPGAIDPAWAKRLEVRLDALNAASQLADVDFPGWQLHELKGRRKRTWSIRVTKNYRLTFRFANADAWEVDLEDYH